MRAIVTGLIVTALTIGVAGAQLTPPPGFKFVDIPASIIQVTIPLTNQCLAMSVVEFAAVERSDLYNVRYTQVHTGIRAGGNRQPPLDVVVGGGMTKSPPPGKYWEALSGNFSATCAEAIANNADDWSDPAVFAYVLLPTTASFIVRGTGTAREFSFDASASFFEPALVSYEWDFGDGQTGTGKTTTHQYAADGEFVVTLTVTDRFGGTATFTVTLVPRLVIIQVLVEPTNPGAPDPFTLRVQVRNDGGVTFNSVTTTAMFSPASIVVPGEGGSSPTSADVLPGTTQWFELPAVAVGDGQATALVHAEGLVDGQPVDAVREVPRLFAVGGAIRAALTAPDAADQGVAFVASLQVTNQSGHVQLVTPGALTAAVPASATITPPMPSTPVQVAVGGSTTFTYGVTGLAAGQLALNASVTAHDLSTLEDVVLQRTKTVAIAGDVGLQVTPTFTHLAVGQTGTVTVEIANGTGQALTDVAVDFAIAPVQGGTARVTTPGTIPASIAGASAEGTWTVELTHPGSVQFSATLTAKTATTGTAVGAVAAGTVEIAAPTIGLAGGPLGQPLPLGDARANADLQVVVTNFAPGIPVAIRWDGSELKRLTPGADGRATGAVQIGHFPTRASCSGLMQARQGDLITDTGVQGSSGEEMVAADGVTFSDDAPASAGRRCRGEVLVFPTTDDYLFVGKAFGGNNTAEREELAGDGTVKTSEYAGIWVQAPGLLLSGVIANLLRVERPRAGAATPFQQTFAFEFALTPDFFESHDPRNKSGVVNFTLACSRVQPDGPLTGYARSSHRTLSILYPVTGDGLIFYSEHNVQFLGNGTSTPSLTTHASSLFVREAVRIWGDATVGSSSAGGQSPTPALFTPAIDIRRRSPQATCTSQTAATGTNVVAVESNEGFAAGDQVAVNPNEANEEAANVVALGSLILDRPLANDHEAGEAVVKVGTSDEPPSCDLLRGAAGVSCWCRQGLRPAGCGTTALPKNVRTQFARGCALTEQAAATTSKKAKRLARSAGASFRKVAKLARKAVKKKTLTADCAAQVAASVGGTP